MHIHSSASLILCESYQEERKRSESQRMEWREGKMHETGERKNGRIIQYNDEPNWTIFFGNACELSLIFTIFPENQLIV